MEDFLEDVGGGAIWGLGFGAAGLLLAAFGRGFRPIAKTMVKGGIVVGDWIREATAETRESLQDIYEEAKAERARPAVATAGAAPAAPAPDRPRAPERPKPAE